MAAEGTPYIEPKTDQIAIKARSLSDITAIEARLSKLQVFTVTKKEGALRLLQVESRDLQKRPFLFFIITLAPSMVHVDYTIPQDVSEKMRRLHVLKSTMSVLALITDLYQVDQTELLQYADSAIDDFVGSVSQNYSTLFNNYDSLAGHFREIKKQNTDLESSNKILTATAAQLQTENEELKKRLKALEVYSDESLMALMQDWIESHGSSIDIDEFSNNYKVPHPRVEQVLNRMVSLGYIEIRG